VSQATRRPSPALIAARFGAVVLAAVAFGSQLVESDFDIARAPVAYLVPAVALLIATVVSRR
jgi:hypothetical protein